MILLVRQFESLPLPVMGLQESPSSFPGQALGQRTMVWFCQHASIQMAGHSCCSLVIPAGRRWHGLSCPSTPHTGSMGSGCQAKHELQPLLSWHQMHAGGSTCGLMALNDYEGPRYIYFCSCVLVVFANVQSGQPSRQLPDNRGRGVTSFTTVSDDL